MKCNRCEKAITEKQDTNILAKYGVKLQPFCNECYSTKERGLVRHFLYFPHSPLNSSMYKVNLGMLSFLAALTSLLILPYILWNPKASSAIPWLVGILLLVLVLMIWAWVLFFRTKRMLSEFPAEHAFSTPLEKE